MNYYIQGNAAKADKIKAAFERLGYDTSFVQKLSASDNHILFTLPCDYRVHAFHMQYIEADILKRLVNIDPDYKELELPVEPKFKVGDSLQSGSTWARIRRIDTEKRWYICDFDNVIPFEEQDSWSLVPNPKPHYDIANFHAGMPVLVRDYDNSRWSYVQFSHYVGEECGFKFNACGIPYIQCIPFNDDTKHLLGTTDMCPEEYVNW